MCVTSPRPRCPPTRRPGHQGRGGVQAGLRAVSCGFRSARQAIFRGLRLELESVPLLMMCLHSRRSGGGGRPLSLPTEVPTKTATLKVGSRACPCLALTDTQRGQAPRASRTQRCSGATARSPATRSAFSWFLHNSFIFEIVCFLHCPPHPFTDF